MTSVTASAVDIKPVKGNWYWVVLPAGVLNGYGFRQPVKAKALHVSEQLVELQFNDNVRRRQVGYFIGDVYFIEPVVEEAVAK